MAKLAIKSDNRKQNLLLPPSLDELIPENHVVRVVDAVIDRLDISGILSTYHGGGNSAFNPRMMLKILVFAYLSNVYSSRRIEELLHRDIYFMWLAGMKRPDFRTINYYRGKRLKEGFDPVFTQGRSVASRRGFRVSQSPVHRWHQDRISCQQVYLCVARFGREVRCQAQGQNRSFTLPD